jgi:hypothetical protein
MSRLWVKCGSNAQQLLWEDCGIFTLMSLGQTPRDQEWRHNAIRQLHTWDVDPEHILNRIPESGPIQALRSLNISQARPLVRPVVLLIQNLMLKGPVHHLEEKENSVDSPRRHPRRTLEIPEARIRIGINLDNSVIIQPGNTVRRSV